MHRESGGVSGQVGQLVRQLADHGAVAPGPTGAWVLRGEAIGPLPLPTGIREVMQERLSRLNNAARGLIEAAAVVGLAVEPGLLEVTSGLPPEAFRVALGELLAQRLLRESSAGPGHYEFASVANRRAVSDLTVRKYPPAKPGALGCEPLKAAGRGR